MSSNLTFTITNAGIAAVSQSGSGGPQVDLTTFEVGSAVNYTPSVGDTGLHGTVLYRGNISTYAVDSNDAVTYGFGMDQTVGTFSFGEIGLYTNGGVLFALAAYSQTQEKIIASSQNPGNIVSLQAKLVLSNIAPAITFTQVLSTNAQLLEIPAPDGLPVPGPIGPSNPNVYSIQGGDEAGNPIIAVRETSQGLWSFSTHPAIVLQALTTGASTTTIITSSAIQPSAFNYQNNRYIIQFTSGANKGIARYIAGVASGQYTISALLNAPALGDAFNVYVSTSFRLSEYNFGYDSGTVNSYILTVVPPINAASEGMVFSFIPLNTNSGAATVTIASSTYQLYGMAGALQGGEIKANSRVVILFHSGAAYLLSSTQGALPVGTAVSSNHAVQLGQLTNGSIAPTFGNTITNSLTASNELTILGTSNILNVTTNLAGSPANYDSQVALTWSNAVNIPNGSFSPSDNRILSFALGPNNHAIVRAANLDLVASNEILLTPNGAAGSAATLTAMLNAISINGTLAVSGNTALNTLSAASTTVNGTLAVSGNTALNTLSATNTAINGTFNATGNATLAAIAVSGTLNVSGNTTLNALAVNGNLQVTDSASQSGIFLSNGTNSVAGLRGSSATNDNGYLFLNSAGANQFTIYTDGINNFLNSVTGQTALQTGGNTRLYITPAGNVGVNTPVSGATFLTYGEIISTGLGPAGIAQIQAIGGVGTSWYNSMLRNDGTSVFLLSSSVETSQAAAINAVWNNWRPFAWNLASGAVNIDQTGSGTTFGGMVALNAPSSGPSLNVNGRAGVNGVVTVTTGEIATSSNAALLLQSSVLSGPQLLAAPNLSGGSWNPIVIANDSGIIAKGGPLVLTTQSASSGGMRITGANVDLYGQVNCNGRLFAVAPNSGSSGTLTLQQAAGGSVNYIQFVNNADTIESALVGTDTFGNLILHSDSGSVAIQGTELTVPSIVFPGDASIYTDTTGANAPGDIVIRTTPNGGGSNNYSVFKNTGDMVVPGQVYSAASRLVGLNDFAFNASANGYQKLPNGLILQWGTTVPIATTAYDTAPQATNYPLTFPTATLCIVATTYAGTTTAQDVASACTLGINVTGFNWLFLNPNGGVGNGSFGIRWIAIGY